MEAESRVYDGVLLFFNMYIFFLSGESRMPECADVYIYIYCVCVFVCLCVRAYVKKCE